MGEICPVAAFALRERGKKFDDALTKVDRQAGDGTQLDDDRIHLPVPTGQTDVHQRFGDSQVRRRTDGDKLRQTLNYTKNRGKHVIVQVSSPSAQSILCIRYASRPRP